MSNTDQKWWSEEYGFFGDFYMQGDDSNDGYLIEKKQNLLERTKTEVEGVINLLKVNEGASILDCPCGYGRHSNYLAKSGYKVVGSDINSTHLAIAKSTADISTNVDFMKENMLDINYENKFDAIINMFYSFGFFDSEEDNYKVLENFYRALKPGGKFLMHTDVNVPRILEGQYKEDETRPLTDGNSLRIIDKYDAERKRIEGAWIINNGSEIRKDYSVRVYTEEEFIDLCKQVGFKICTSYSDWKANPYSPDAEDMIIIAEK